MKVISATRNLSRANVLKIQHVSPMRQLIVTRSHVQAIISALYSCGTTVQGHVTDSFMVKDFMNNVKYFLLSV